MRRKPASHIITCILSLATMAFLSSATAAQSATENLPKAWVANTGDGSVSCVDLNQLKEISRIHVGKDPYGIALSHDQKTLVVGVEGEEKLKFFDIKDLKLKGEFHIGKMFHDHIMLSKDSKNFLIAEYGNDELLAVDADTMKETFHIKGLSGPHVTKYGPTEKRNYVTCKKTIAIASIDADNPGDIKVWPLNVNPRSLSFSSDESKLYFASFWIDGIFELETSNGKIARLLQIDPPAENKKPQEVTYHGVEVVGSKTVLAANEGRSYVDSIDIASGKLISRLTDVVKPCCLERVPTSSANVKVLVSSTGDGQVELVEVMPDGKLKIIGKVKVGDGPKRVVFAKD